jgi:type IV secretory pathway VirB4 component
VIVVADSPFSALELIAAVRRHVCYDAGERAWASEWIATLLARESVTITPDLKEHLWSALTSLAFAPWRNAP